MRRVSNVPRIFRPLRQKIIITQIITHTKKAGSATRPHVRLHRARTSVPVALSPVKVGNPRRRPARPFLHLAGSTAPLPCGVPACRSARCPSRLCAALLCAALLCAVPCVLWRVSPSGSWSERPATSPPITRRVCVASVARGLFGKSLSCRIGQVGANTLC